MATTVSRFIQWRWILYVSLFVGWASYYFCRKTFPASIPDLITHVGLSKDDVGVVSSSFAVAYGFSKFVASILSDCVSPRKMFSAGLVLSGLGCLAFPLWAHNVLISSLVWFMQGLVQGLGWAPCVKLLKLWFPPGQIGTWWSVLSSGGNVSAAVAPLLVTFLSSAFDWRASFLAVGALALGLGVTVMFTITDSPSVLGVEPFQRTETKEEKKKEEEVVIKKAGKPSKLQWYSVLFQSNLWVASVVYAALYVVKNAVADWSQLYFIEVAHKPQAVAAACMGMMPIGGIMGLLVAGYVSDLFITPKTLATRCPRAPVLLCISVLMLAFLQLFASTVGESSSELWLSVMVFGLGFLSDGGISMIGLISMEVVPSEISGSAHGLACAIAQVGGFAAGWPFALIIEQFSWSSAYYFLETCSIIMILLSSYLFTLMIRDLSRKKKE